MWRTPAESPDLNPIEMVWAHMKAWVQERAPRNIQQLDEYIQEYRRTQLTPALCKKFINHLEKVIPAVMANEGRQSGY